MKTRRLAALAAILLITAAPRIGRAAGRFSCDASGSPESVRFSSVNEKLDLFLGDGRMIYFPTIEPPRATPAAPERPKDVATELTSLLAGKALSLQKLGAPDRWGRIPASLLVEGEQQPVDELLAASGLVMASAELGACGASSVRAAEAFARADRLGVWSDPAYAVISAENTPELSGRAGALALVEGRVASIGHTAPRLYLNFGARRNVSLTIAKRNRQAFERAGLTEKSLLHKQIRARGVLEIGASPQIELFHPDQIEAIEDGH